MLCGGCKWDRHTFGAVLIFCCLFSFSILLVPPLKMSTEVNVSDAEVFQEGFDSIRSDDSSINW